MTLTLTILGCGSSAGVPRPALGWGRCDPNNPRNRRRRCSLLVERKASDGMTRVVIDTSPDLREQLIDANVDHLDAVFLTHEHADQTHGIDDLRSVMLHQRRRIPTYFNQSTAKDIMARFSYCFIAPEGSDYPPILEYVGIEEGEERTVTGKGGALTLSAFEVEHGNIPVTGYRFNDIAYTPVCDRDEWQAFKNRCIAQFGADKLKENPLNSYDAAVEIGVEAYYDSRYRGYCQYTHGALEAVSGSLDELTDPEDTRVMLHSAMIALEALADMGAQCPSIASFRERFSRVISQKPDKLFRWKATS